jgi:hypothetical protein
VTGQFGRRLGGDGSGVIRRYDRKAAIRRRASSLTILIPAAVAFLLTSSTDPAPNDMAGAIIDGYNKFQQTFPQCNSVLDTITWIIDQIHELFCGAG